MSALPNRCCGTCRWWERAGASTSTALRDPVAQSKEHLGVCVAVPPFPVRGALASSGVFPTTHEARVCGSWTPEADGPDDGERVTAEVVPFRSAA